MVEFTDNQIMEMIQKTDALQKENQNLKTDISKYQTWITEHYTDVEKKEKDLKKKEEEIVKREKKIVEAKKEIDPREQILRELDKKRDEIQFLRRSLYNQADDLEKKRKEILYQEKVVNHKLKKTHEFNQDFYFRALNAEKVLRRLKPRYKWLLAYSIIFTLAVSLSTKIVIRDFRGIINMISGLLLSFTPFSFFLLISILSLMCIGVRGWIIYRDTVTALFTLITMGICLTGSLIFKINFYILFFVIIAVFFVIRRILWINNPLRDAYD